ncbi:MAG: 3-dehydroquinate synthase [Sediminicola sp.]
MHITESIEQSFSVPYRYKLHFTEALFDQKNPLLDQVIAGNGESKVSKVFFVIDGGVADAHPNLEQKVRDYCMAYPWIQFRGSMTVMGGEQVKNEAVPLEGVLKAINDNNICRHSFVAVIGGGAVVDMVGYACAIAHRGVKLLRIPTTVLAQNDSAVGVKNSINYFGKKNFLGTFAPPFAIINDRSFLTTLEQRDWVSGIAEAIKVALIKDVDFFVELERTAKKLRERDMESMQYLIYRCAELHMHHIAQGGDPFESGSSRPLDFGHWAAHKMEHMTQYSIRHGEAVAIGMAIDLTYAQLIGLISENTLGRILTVMEEMGFSLKLPIQVDRIETLLQGIEEFREHLGGRLTITLISDIGSKHDVHEIDMEVMKSAITTFL